MQQKLRQIVESFLVSNTGGLATTKVTKKSGEPVFNAGYKGHFMYLLEKGKVDIRHEGRTLEAVEAGGIVGEMSLVDDDASRSADAIVRQDATLIPINQQKFRELVQKNADFALAVITVLARRLREMNERITASQGG